MSKYFVMRCTNLIMNMIYPQCTSNSVDILYFSEHEVVVLSDILFIMAASEMSSIQKELNLGQTIFSFENEKITPDIVCKLSSTDLESLGLSSRRDMNLRMECSKYGVQKPTGVVKVAMLLHPISYRRRHWSHTWKKGSQFKKLDLFFQYLKVQYIVG